MATLMLGACAALLAIVWSLPSGSLAFHAVAIVAGVAIALVTASLLEWLIHHYIYHRSLLPLLGRIYRIHHHGHHHAVFPPQRYVTSGSPERHPVLGGEATRLHPPGWRNVATRLAHAGFYLAVGAGCVWLPLAFLGAPRTLVLTLVVANGVIADLVVRVHDAIHYPDRHAWLHRQGWFRFLDRHHYIHHIDTEANVNFLLPLADLLFGTLRPSLTLAEEARHGTWEAARRRDEAPVVVAAAVGPREPREIDEAPTGGETTPQG